MPKTPLLPKRHCSAFYKLVAQAPAACGIAYSRERKEPEEITEEDNEFHRQQSRDWMMWCFIVGQDTQWLADNLLCAKEDVRQEIDCICGGVRDCTRLPPMLSQTPWNKNQELVLRKCKQAARSLTATATLLSRSEEEVRQRSRQLQQGNSNG